MFVRKRGMLENVFVKEQKTGNLTQKLNYTAAIIPSLQNVTVYFNIIQLQGVIYSVLYVI
jgi:hypothetical protein